MSPRFLLTLAIVTGFCTPSVVFAHTGALEEVVVIGRRNEQASTQERINQGVLDREHIQSAPVEFSGDLLAKVPGLITTQHSGSGKASQYYLRGFNLDHGTDFATYVDAMPVNQVSHGHGQGYTDLNFVITELIQKIDYRKGPFYADTGDFSGTGSARLNSVNFLPSNQLRLELGDFGYARGFMAQQWEVGEGAWLFAGEHQQYDGPWRTLDEQVNKRNAFLKYSTGHPQSGWDLTAMHYANSWNSADQIPQRKIDDHTLTRFDVVDPSSGGDSRRNSVSWQLRHHNPLGSGYVSVYGIQSDLNLWSNFTYFTQPQGDQFYQQDRRTTTGGEAKWGFAESFLPGFENKHVVGLQWREDHVRPVALADSQDRVMADVIRKDRVNTEQLGLYWQGLWRWHNDFSSAFHLRWNRHQFNVLTLAAKNPSTLGENTGARKADLWTGAWQNYWQVHPQVELYLNLGRSYHSNDARGVLAKVDPISAAPLDSADPLSPVNGAEIGWAWHTEPVSLSITGWVLKVDSEQVFVGDAGTTENTQMAGHRQGLEGLLIWQPLDSTKINLSVNESRAVFTPNGEAIPNTLPRVVGLSWQWQVSETFDFSVSWRYFGSYLLAEQQRAAASQKISAQLHYQMKENWSWNFVVLNASNAAGNEVEYGYESQWPDEAAAVFDRHIHPVVPRQLRVSLQYEY